MAKYKGFSHFEGNTSNTICDVSGFKKKLSETKQRWDGYEVIPEMWETRHPQDFQVTPRAPKVYPDSRPEQEIRVYTPVEDVTKL